MIRETGEKTSQASAAQVFDSALENGREALDEPFPPRPVPETESPEAIGTELDDALDRHLPYREAESLWWINGDFERKVRKIIWRMDLRLLKLRCRFFWLRERENIFRALRLCVLLAISLLVYQFREELLAALSDLFEAIRRAVSLLPAPPSLEGRP